MSNEIDWDTHEPTAAVRKAAIVLFSADAVDAMCFGWVPQAHAAIAVALDDPELANRIRDWRLTPCEHSRLLHPASAIHDEPAEYEQACSPCLRDRLRSHLLGGAS